MDKITKSIANSIFYLDNGEELTMTISSGSTSKMNSLDSMVLQADEYMYKAKNSGKNKVYTEE